MRLLILEHAACLILGDREQQCVLPAGKVMEELALLVPVRARMSSKVAIPTPSSLTTSAAPSTMRARVACPFGVKTPCMMAPSASELDPSVQIMLL